MCHWSKAKKSQKQGANLLALACLRHRAYQEEISELEAIKRMIMSLEALRLWAS